MEMREKTGDARQESKNPEVRRREGMQRICKEESSNKAATA
jgi:hypothetical protein